MDHPKDALISLLDEKITCNPNDLESLLSRGRAYHEEDCFDEAIRDYTQAIQLNPKYAKCAGVYTECAKVYIERGHIYRNMKKYDESIDDYTKAIALDSKYAKCAEVYTECAKVYTSRGDIYSRRKKYGESINNYNQAIALDSKYARAYHGRGLAYRYRKSMDKQKDLNQAICDYNQAIKLDSKYAKVYVDRAYVYNNIEMYDEAIDDLTKAICLQRNDSRKAEAYNQRGNAYRRKSELEKARLDYEEAINFHPRYAAAHNSMGNYYRDQCKYKKALIFYDKAIDLKPDRAFMTYINRGNVYYKMGCYNEALDDFDNAARLCSNNWRDNFVDVDFVLGGRKGIGIAIEFIEKKAGVLGSPSGAQDYYRGVGFRLKNYTKLARKYFKRAQKYGYKGCRATEHLKNL